MDSEWIEFAQWLSKFVEGLLPTWIRCLVSGAARLEISFDTIKDWMQNRQTKYGKFNLQID